MAKRITVTVSGSAHPDYELFADVRDASNNRQVKAKRGSRAEIDAWYDYLATVAKKHNVEIILINE
jgi:hypothetical protein